MGQRGSAEKKRSEQKPKTREEFVLDEKASTSTVLTLPRPTFERLARFLTVRDSIHLTQVCKLSNNKLFKSCIDCYEATLPFPTLNTIVTVGYWRLSGVNVKFEDGENLTRFPAGALSMVRRMRVKCQLVDLDALTEVPELQTLSVTWCRQLANVDGIKNCPNLLTAALIGCNFTDVSAFSACSTLHTLDLSYSEDLKQVNGLGECAGLRSLRLHNCSGLMDVHGLSGCPSLTALNLSGCVNLQDIGPLSSVVSLETVNLSNNLVLCDVSPLVALPHLHTLDLSSVRELVQVNVLADCPALRILNISCCFRVTDWTELSRCSTLTTLSTGGLDKEGRNRDSVSYSAVLMRGKDKY